MHETLDRTDRRRFRTVVVLNMHYSGLGIARDLRGSGLRVLGLGSDDALSGRFTRFAETRWFPDTAREPEACVRFLVDLAAKLPGGALLLPTRDHDVALVLRHREVLERAFVLPYPSSDRLATIVDKDRFVAVAREIGIDCPLGWRIESRAELDAVLDEIPFPCIVKPVRSTQWRNSPIWKITRQKVVSVQDRGGLLDLYGRIEPYDGLVQIQEFVPGGDERLEVVGSYVNPDTGVFRYFTGHKLLQHPPRSGTGVAVRACRIPDLVDPARRLLLRLGYRGISEFEFKRHPDTGRRILIEMNPRHWDQHTLGTAVGVNLSRVLCDDLLGRPVPEAVQQERQVTWIADDEFAYAAIHNLSARQVPGRRFREALEGPVRMAVADLRDPVPGLHLAWTTAGRWARQSLGRIVRTVGPSGGGSRS